MDLAAAIRPYVRAAGIATSPQSVSNWERGRDPSSSEFGALLHVLGCPVEALTREVQIQIGGAA